MVEHGVGETADLTTAIGDHGVLVQPGRSEAIRPDLQTISDDVTVKV